MRNEYNDGDIESDDDGGCGDDDDAGGGDDDVVIVAAISAAAYGDESDGDNWFEDDSVSNLNQITSLQVFLSHKFHFRNLLLHLLFDFCLSLFPFPCSLKKQQGVVDRLAEDRQPPAGRMLLGFQSGGAALELFPVLAVAPGHNQPLVSIAVAEANGSDETRQVRISCQPLSPFNSLPFLISFRFPPARLLLCDVLIVLI
jgi:hypothetical protein